MELNNNFISTQGILIRLKEKIGDFTKIRYIAGNTQHINYITNELALFLTDKRLLVEARASPNHIQDLNEIIFFLALNTEFKQQLPISDQFVHLTNIIPQLSKCVLVNICFALNLVEQYGYVIENFPLEATIELLDEVIECLRKGKPEKQLHNTFAIVKCVVNKLSSIELSNKTEDTIDDVTRITTIILQNLTDIPADQAQSMKASQIYQHMGLTLLQCFKLLLYIDESKKTLLQLIAPLVTTTCSLVRCITIKVFCAWAEIDYEDQLLQAVIANKAYLVTEKYQKNKIATELVSMVSTFARKPKTIAERILEADVPTIIKMVNTVDVHQKLWFNALIRKSDLSEPKILECIDRWWELCDETAVERLLNLPVPNNSQEKQLIIKCASSLGLEELLRLLARHFNREHFKWAEDCTNQQILIFNQVSGDLSKEESKQILLLVLQNAKTFFHHLYTTAFKRSAELSQVFQLVKYISDVDNIGLEILMQVLDENIPVDQNVSNYVQLFNTMISCQYYSWDFMISHVILPLIINYRNMSNLEAFKCCLQVLKHFKHLKCELKREVVLYEYILACASENRCKSFLEFDSLKNEITSLSVDYALTKYQELKAIEGGKESFPALDAKSDDPWSNYYKNVFLSDETACFTEWILPSFDLSNYKEGEVEENFTRLLKVLPRCVPSEWKILLDEIIEKSNFTNVLNALSDIMILLCDFVDNQLKHQQGEDDSLLLALQFCLQNYGTFMVSSSKSRDQEISTINSLCRVLKHIPDPLKRTEGLSLINALSEEALKSLARDKEFVGRIILINDKQLCKALAQKVLAA